VSGWSDLPDGMRHERIDEDTLDRLLRGRMAPDDAPPGYADVASLLRAVASLPSNEDLHMEIDHVSSARAVVGIEARRRRPRIRRLTAGLVLAGALAAVPGLAAANVLPDAAQHAVARILDGVGISVPGNEEPATDPAADHPASTGSEVSGIATTTDATGVDKGAAISSVASGGMSRAGQHGQGAPDVNGGPPVSTPHTEGGGAGNRVDRGSADVGAATAHRNNDGRSDLGSRNGQASPRS
jgi:hypothetical protein